MHTKPIIIAIDNLKDAALFSVTGFVTVLSVLTLITVAVYVFMMLERVFFKPEVEDAVSGGAPSAPSEMSSSGGIKPEIIAVIAAAVSVALGGSSDTRYIGGVRRPTAWYGESVGALHSGHSPLYRG
ncbi:hypothetical protein RsTz2092_05060 [Deferribacterales bacterium RsTz2092]|nr:hypothetical protein AGMMS49941_03890 [Deferribacterales bacterium]